jgi:hypothetical protein
LRISHRFTDVSVSGEVHDRRHLVHLKRHDQPVPVREIASDEQPPTHSLAMSASQIVENHRMVSGSRQYVVPDVPCSARDQY